MQILGIHLKALNFLEMASNASMFFRHILILFGVIAK